MEPAAEWSIRAFRWRRRDASRRPRSRGASPCSAPRTGQRDHADAAPLVLLLAGLPGAGKTTLAHRLAPEIDAVILSRDDIRDAIFPQHYLDYTTEQNKVATDALLRVLDYLLERPRPPYVIVDGKPFSRREEISEVKALVDGRARAC